MRVPGYCTSCRRIKSNVNASGHAVALAHALGTNVPEGTCANCQEEEDEARAERYRQRRPQHVSRAGRGGRAAGHHRHDGGDAAVAQPATEADRGAEDGAAVAAEPVQKPTDLGGT